MKKAVFLLPLVGAALLLAGCSRGGDSFAPEHYAVEGARVAEVRVDVRDRRVEVSPSPDDQIHIDYFESEKEPCAISLSEDGTLTVTTESRRDWTDYIGAKPSADVRRLSLRLPDSHLRAIALSTTNADLAIAALPAVGEATLTVNGGDVAFECLTVEKAVSLTVKNGNIRGVLAGSYADYSVDCDMKKGESNLPSHPQSGAKPLKVRCNNGNVSVTFAEE